MASSPRARKKLSAHELDRFLFYLARTGNFAFACDRLGRAQSGLYKRRARDPDFDAECREALARARSSLWRTEGGRRSAPKHPARKHQAGADPKSATVLTTHAGRPQLRRAAPGTLTKAGRERFLVTLAATANIRFAAHSVGLAPSSIHHRRRTDPDFARDMDAAIETAVAELELRIIEASGVLADDGPGAGAALAGLTAAEALHFLTLHQRKQS